MHLIITGRHMEVSQALRQYIESRMRRLERYARTIGDVQVVVGVEKYRHTAEMTFRLNGRVIQAKCSTTEMYGSVDQLVDKVLRQVRKRKEQLVNHKPRRSRIRTAPDLGPVETPQVEVSRPPLRTLSVDEALGYLDRQTSGIVVFVNAESGHVQVVRRLESGLPELIDPQPA
jgi:putative sigma-54 modulation protein